MKCCALQQPSEQCLGPELLCGGDNLWFRSAAGCASSAAPVGAAAFWPGSAGWSVPHVCEDLPEELSPHEVRPIPVLQLPFMLVLFNLSIYAGALQPEHNSYSWRACNHHLTRCAFAALALQHCLLRMPCVVMQQSLRGSLCEEARLERLFVE